MTYAKQGSGSAEEEVIEEGYKEEEEEQKEKNFNMALMAELINMTGAK